MPDPGAAEAAEVASDEDGWGLHWALLSGKQVAAPGVPDRQSTSDDGGAAPMDGRSTAADDGTPAGSSSGGEPEDGGRHAPVDSSSGPAASPNSSGTPTSPSPVDSGATAADGGAVPTESSTPSAGGCRLDPPADGAGAASVDGRAAPANDCGATGGTAGGKARSTTEGSLASGGRGAASGRSTAASFDSSATSADGSTSSAGGGGPPSDKIRSGQKWSRVGSASTASREVTDSDSSDADSGATRSTTRMSFEDVLDAPEHAEGAVYSRRQLLQLRPGCCRGPAATARRTAAPPVPLKVAARPAAGRPAPPGRQSEKGSSARGGFFIPLECPDEFSTNASASLLQAEMLLEALTSDEPLGSNGSAAGGAAGQASKRQPLTAMSSRPLTTMMLRNIPNRHTRPLLQKQLDHTGFKGEYDVVYVPVDRVNKNNSLGYAFINFRDALASSRFAARFHGAPARELFPESGTGKVLGVCYAEVQGREAYLERHLISTGRFAGGTGSPMLRPCAVGPRPVPCEEADRAGRPRCFFPGEGWTTREAWASWPWGMHPNQRISISDSLPGGQACAWGAATAAPRGPAPAQRQGGGGRGRGHGAGVEAGVAAAAAKGRSPGLLCAEAPEFVPALASAEVPAASAQAAHELQVGLEGFELPPAAGPHHHSAETAAINFPSQHAEFVPVGMMGAAAAAQWTVPGEMPGCGYWESMTETTMPMGSGAGYDGHDAQAAMYSWPYAEFGAAPA